MTSKISSQLKSIKTVFLWVYIPIVFLSVLVILVSFNTGLPIGSFLRDPATIVSECKLNPGIQEITNSFLGIVSNIGILFWCICASICLFSFLIIAKSNTNHKSGPYLFLGIFGLISLILLLDDLFLFHELIDPQILRLSEDKVIAIYGLLVLFGIIRFRKVILQTEWIILSFAFIFFALSVVIDLFLFVPNLSSSQLILGDGCKLFGIASWLSYFVRVSWQIVQNAISSSCKIAASMSNRNKLIDQNF